MEVYAVIPGLNVEKTVGNVVKECMRYVDKVIFVDDGSSDDSGKVAEKAGADIIVLPFNCGKGFALRTGFAVALSQGADIVIAIDSDGQCYPKYIPDFLKALKGKDVVIGSRYAGRFYTFSRNVIGNFGLNFITNILAFGPAGMMKKDKWVSDTQSGYRAFNRYALEKMRLTARRYEIESEMVYEIGRNRLKWIEIPIESKAKIRGVKIRDGFHNARLLLKRFFRL